MAKGKASVEFDMNDVNETTRTDLAELGVVFNHLVNSGKSTAPTFRAVRKALRLMLSTVTDIEIERETMINMLKADGRRRTRGGASKGGRRS